MEHISKTLSNGTMMHKFGGNVLYRILRDEESRNALFAKNPKGAETLLYFNKHGSQKNVKTQFLAFSRNVSSLRKHIEEYEPDRLYSAQVAVLDLDKLLSSPDVCVEVYDVSTKARAKMIYESLGLTEGVKAGYVNMACNYVAASEEVDIVCPDGISSDFFRVYPLWTVI